MHKPLSQIGVQIQATMIKVQVVYEVYEKGKQEDQPKVQSTIAWPCRLIQSAHYVHISGAIEQLLKSAVRRFPRCFIQHVSIPKIIVRIHDNWLKDGALVVSHGVSVLVLPWWIFMWFIFRDFHGATPSHCPYVHSEVPVFLTIQPPFLRTPPISALSHPVPTIWHPWSETVSRLLGRSWTSAPLFMVGCVQKQRRKGENRVDLYIICII